ncbi:MAG: SatD family protein [Verrucomicrobiota bacterium]
MRLRLVLIGDLVGSREAAERAALQTQLKKACTAASKVARAEKRLLSPYTITLGDEFQAVLSRGTGLFGDCLRIQEMLYPECFRIGLGVGEISTPINRKAALEMDGEAFYKAREAIDALKRSGERVHLACSAPADWLNTFASLAWHNLENSRSVTRIQIARRLLAGCSGREIAAELGLSEGTVSGSIERGALQTLCRGFKLAEAAIDAMLSQDG